MKQHITKEQYHELNDDAKIKLVEWISSWTKGTDPITMPYQDMTIGRMIEFIKSKGYYRHDTYIDDNTDHLIGDNYVSSDLNGDHRGREDEPLGVSIAWCGEEELCDALWEAVKHILGN